VQFRGEEFLGWMAIDKQRVTIGLGDAPQADVIVDGTIKELFTGRRPPEHLCVGGSKKKLGRFMSAFVQPA
jgi:hypothetical protein